MEKAKVWIAQENVPFFEEKKRMGHLSFSMYEVPDQTDNVCSLAA